MMHKIFYISRFVEGTSLLQILAYHRPPALLLTVAQLNGRLKTVVQIKLLGRLACNNEVHKNFQIYPNLT